MKASVEKSVCYVGIDVAKADLQVAQAQAEKRRAAAVAQEQEMRALVEENNSLLVRVRQRARQNHLLLSHAVELMQQLINSIFPGSSPKTYDNTGRLPVNHLPNRSIYERVC